MCSLLSLTLFVMSLGGAVATSTDKDRRLHEEPLLYDSFPPDFQWGVGTASYQIEGGWNEGGKGLSVWDVFSNPELGHIEDSSDGKVACDSYHKYKEDVQLVKSMGMGAYRFSIAWPRILPNGIGEVNPEGVAYYNSLIDELLLHGIQPVATLYHWDLPQLLEDKGGWTNAEIVQWFKEYARICFKEFGDRVKMWVTLNEPWITSVMAYGQGPMTLAPGRRGNSSITYLVAHNQILAHAAVYRMYHEEFAGKQNGRVGIACNVNWAEPSNPAADADVAASERAMQFHLGWFAHPILKDGSYPPVMRRLIAEKSLETGLSSSRLPEFSPDEAKMVGGSSDFLGINFYTSQLVTASQNKDKEVSYEADSDVEFSYDEDWPGSGSVWLKVTPFGLRKTMLWVKKEYGSHVDVAVMENGVSDKQQSKDDLHRIYYYKHYLNQLLKAIVLDKCNVKGYFAWSLLDNFEWAKGYLERFGLHFVDFNDPARPRTAKASAKYLASLVKQNGFAETGNPDYSCFGDQSSLFNKQQDPNDEEACPKR